MIAKPRMYIILMSDDDGKNDDDAVAMHIVVSARIVLVDETSRAGLSHVLGRALVVRTIAFLFIFTLKYANMSAVCTEQNIQTVRLWYLLHYRKRCVNSKRAATVFTCDDSRGALDTEYVWRKE